MACNAKNCEADAGSGNLFQGLNRLLEAARAANLSSKSRERQAIG